jgi:NIPSNAP
MILEMRTYQVHAGKAPEFLKIYQDNGLHIITRYAKLVGCWTKESGTLNSIVFLWGYDDFGHRSAQRAQMAQDTQWQAFVPTILPYLVHQESVFLNPVSFSPIQ